MTLGRLARVFKGMIRARALWFLAAIPGLATVVPAQVQLSFPLERYRVGRYMPIRVRVASDAAAPLDLKIGAAGSFRTGLTVVPGAEIVAPFLPVVDLPSELEWSTQQGGGRAAVAPRPLEDDERLVGDVAGDLDILARALFPGLRVVTVHLDPAKPLPGPIAAWETLDALVLDESAAARLQEGELKELLAASTVVAIRTSRAPNDLWPWRQLGEYWVLRPGVIGPRAAVVPAAYVPVQRPAEGWPAAVRRQAVIIVFIFSILLCGAALWRSKWAAAVALLLAVMCLAALHAWRGRQQSWLQSAGSIRVRGELTQDDRWTYRRAIAPANLQLKWTPGAKPVLFSRRQLEAMDLTLNCGPDGKPAFFSFQLPRGGSIAFLQRTVLPAAPSAGALMRPESPLRPVAEELYGDRATLMGELPPPAEGMFSTVLMAVKSAAP